MVTRLIASLPYKYLIIFEKNFSKPLDNTKLMCYNIAIKVGQRVATVEYALSYSYHFYFYAYRGGKYYEKKNT